MKLANYRQGMGKREMVFTAFKEHGVRTTIGDIFFLFNQYFPSEATNLTDAKFLVRELYSVMEEERNRQLEEIELELDNLAQTLYTTACSCFQQFRVGMGNLITQEVKDYTPIPKQGFSLSQAL